MLALLLACNTSELPGHSDSNADSASESAADTDSGETGPPDSGESAETGETGDTSVPCADTAVWYLDADGDGFGGEEGCSTDSGATQVAFDCDDTHATVNPGAVELATSGRDDDCDGRGATTDLTMLGPLSIVVPGDYCSSCGPTAGVQVGMDANVDGTGDLLVGGAWYEADGSGHAGASIFYSPPRSDRPFLEFADGDARVFLPGGMFEKRGLLLGDTDGDGSSELLLSALVNTYDAAIYILPGPIPAGATQLDESHLFASREDSRMAYFPVAPGDIDGDGLADTVLSDLLGNDSGGELFLFHGSLAGRGLDDADTILRGAPASESGAPYDGLGRSTTNLGDLDGDGLPEIGDIGGDGGNIFYDPPPGTHRFQDVATLIDATYGGYRTTGVDITGVGDVNDDGYRDIAMPTPADPYLLVLFGPFPETETQNLWDDWDVSFYGDNWGLGHTELTTIVSLGDWDADGHEDFAINNPTAVMEELADTCDPERGECMDGAAFLIAGPVSAGVYDIERSADRLNPPGHPDGFADFLAGGSDLDQDGFPDLAIASLTLNSVYVVFGGAFD